MSLRASIFFLAAGLALAAVAAVVLWPAGGRSVSGAELAAVAILVLAAAFLGSGLLARSMRRKRRRLQDAIDAMSIGQFEQRVRGMRNGELRSMARSINALSERVEYELRSLRRAGEDFEALFDDLDDAVAAVNEDGRLAFANRAFIRLAGRPDVFGERVGNLFRSSELVQSLARGLRGTRDQREIRIGDRDLLATVRPHRDGALLVLRDTTQLRQLEEVRRAFVANVSHELKTPLTSIVGFGEAIANGDVQPDRSAQFGERIVANASRMRRLVDDLLDLARVEGGGWQPNVERIALSEEAGDVWASLAPVPEKRNVRLRTDSAAASELRADREAVRQILRNLFDNALRYAPESSNVTLASRLEANGRPGGGMLRIEVTDTGPGIPTAHQKRVFERFYRADPARSREAGGTGLGLAIVKHLVLAHGGEVGIESEVGRGTTAWFTLPASWDAGREEESLRSEHTGRSSAETPGDGESD